MQWGSTNKSDVTWLLISIQGTYWPTKRTPNINTIRIEIFPCGFNASEGFFCLNWREPETNGFTVWTIFNIIATKHKLCPTLSLNHLACALNRNLSEPCAVWLALHQSSESFLYISWSVLCNRFFFMKKHRTSKDSTASKQHAPSPRKETFTGSRFLF